MTVLAADPSAALKMPATGPVAERVKAQLAGDYPPGALAWVDDLSWSGPARVPMDQVDRNSGDWSAADDKRKVAAFARRIAAGWHKPVVAIRRPGTRLLYLVDGHTRAAACAQIGQPLTAYIGAAKSATGPWLKIHSRQLSNDLAALEMSAGGYPAGVVKPTSGMISLDLPDGTVKPVPGGVTDHHVTVVFLGDDVHDQAFAEACARAKAAAASASGPLRGIVRGVDSFPPSGSSDGKRPAFAPVTIPGAQDIRSQLEDLSASEHKDWKPHVTLAYIGRDDPLPAPVPATPVKFTHLSVHRGDDVKRFPLGGAGSSQHAGDSRGIELSAQTARLAITPAPAGNPGGPGLWRVKGMALPPYFENVRNALIRDGHTPADAYRLTWGAIRRWARGGGKVHPEVVDAAQAALADLAAKSARAHAHASDLPAVELAGVFNEQLHPRVPKGHQGGGRFGSANTPLTAKAASGTPTGRLSQEGPEPPAELQRIRQLRFQAAADRHLARQILVKAQSLVRIRDGYIAGLMTPSGTAKTSVTSAKRSATAKKAAKTRKKTVRKKVARSSTKSAAATKAANIAKLDGQIHLLRSDARALIRSANHLDQMANSL
jgi:2'-5' RNA ligase